ncbi:hypothetical protein BKP56_09290 [Marinilactibacillus sp. 15R]|uniref:major tail protein n=1 Tax=Marinilactibacillus sp. 15R TaxID=1911586 RepID=UPI00090B60B3|nr:major tail protein [Marinilactibacillus sp. 15R]API89435.1 hypothetical protein BKP56_09290 [Marinilactibacillus sp. 15R]
MSHVGFRRAYIQFLDEDYNPVADGLHVIEGVANEGATSSFEITNISPEAIKTYGSDIPYHIFNEGVGDVAATFSALDLPYELEHQVLGRQKSENGVHHAGEATRPPFCAVLFESQDLRGAKMGTGLYAGKFGRGTVGSTTKEGSPTALEADQYSFAPSAKLIDGKSETVGFAKGDAEFEALKVELFGAQAETGTETGTGETSTT